MPIRIPIPFRPLNCYFPPSFEHLLMSGAVSGTKGVMMVVFALP